MIQGLFKSRIMTIHSIYWSFSVLFLRFSFNWHLYSIIDGGKGVRKSIHSYQVMQSGILKQKKISRFPRAEVLCYNRDRYPAIVAKFYAIVTMDQRRCSEAENGRIARPLTITDTSSPFRCRLCLIWWRQNAIKHWLIDVKWCLCVAPNTHVSANEVIKK